VAQLNNPNNQSASKASSCAKSAKNAKQIWHTSIRYSIPIYLQTTYKRRPGRAPAAVEISPARALTHSGLCASDSHKPLSHENEAKSSV
jgi:hypothetical protein